MNRRDFLKLAAIVGFTPSSLLANGNVSVPVLMYHDINNDPDDEYSVTPDTFLRHMLFLKHNGYKTIPVNQIESAGAKDVIITFDDGYKSFLTHAYPTLKEFAFHATINLVGKWIGTDIPDIKLRPALSKDDIVKLYKEKNVDFGCHTFDLHSHRRNVTHYPEWKIRRDLTQFQFMYFEMIGTTADVIAWPFGKYTDEAIRAAKDVGFKYFLTSHYGKYSGNNDRIERLAITKQRKIEKLIHG